MLCDSPNFNKLSSPSEPTSLNKKAIHNLDNPLSPPCVKTSFILPKTPSLTQPSSPTSLNISDLDNHLVPDVNKNDNSFSDRLNSQTRASSSSNITRRFHPNIQHRPTIHPHSHYQRQVFNKSNNITNDNNTNKMPEECNVESSVVPVVNNNDNENSLDISNSCSDYSSGESNGVIFIFLKVKISIFNKKKIVEC